MSIAVDIIRKFNEFGLQEVIEEYSKEDIDFAINSEIKENIKNKLKIISSNWLAAEKLLGAVKSLTEIVTPEDDESYSEEEDFDPDFEIEEGRDFSDYDEDDENW